MSLRAWFRDDGPWWGPYLGVALLGAVAALAVLLVLAPSAPEILRTLRSAGN